MFDDPTREALRILLWMGLPILFGGFLWQCLLSGRPNGETRAASIGRHATRLALLFTATPIMFLAAWIAPLPDGKGVFLPLVGLSVHLAGTLTGWILAARTGHPPAARAAFLLGGGCSNVLTFGGITVVFLLRSPDDPAAEAAIAEMTLYRMLELPYYFLVAWPLAALVAQGGEQGQSWTSFLLRSVKSPAMAPVLGLVTGLALNVARIERPPLFDGATAILVRWNVFLLGTTVGLSLRHAAPRTHLGSCLSIAAIKFLVMPCCGIGLAWALGYRGLTLQVVAICSTMPVAFMAVVGAAYYRLDEGLVGSFWLVTTAAMLVVIPLLAYAVPHLSG